MSATLQSRNWDLSRYFPSLESAELEAALVAIEGALTSLETEIANAKPGDDAPLEGLLCQVNDVRAKLQLAECFVAAYSTTDSTNELAISKESRIDGLNSRLGALMAGLAAWIGTLDVEAAISDGEEAHAFFLRKAKARSQKLMSPAEERLAAALQTVGSMAWSRLHGMATSQILVEVKVEGEAKKLPMSAVRALAYDANEATRTAAYEAELAAWKENELPCAAAMNAIKGEVNLLATRRGWKSPLEAALFGENMEQGALEAMLAAAKESFPDFRRYLRAKAKLLGKKALPFSDIFAPVGDSPKRYSWEEGCEIVESAFRSYSTKMGDFAARAFREQWVDVDPRPGKRDGAYCMGPRGDESLVFMNFKPSFGSVSTLAHELGHAYHNLCLADRTPIQADIPMTLAETASIFCETILRKRSMAEGSDAELLPILEASLQGSCQVVVDITSRFLFESEVFARRQSDELSAGQLCEIMRGAQLETYGDGLDAERLHPYMWAAKPHYYSGGLSFYNFPYMFGLLFALGLYSIYEKEGAAFQDRYDALLGRTGMATSRELALEFGFDTHSIDFWRGSLSTIRADIDRFVAIVG